MMDKLKLYGIRTDPTSDESDTQNQQRNLNSQLWEVRKVMMKTNYKLTDFAYSVAFISMVLWSYL